jgi:molybdopterin-guanine dinucleotide biosynthesis protein A
MPPDLCAKLAEELENGNYQLVYASTKEANGKIWAQPVFCFMRSDVESSLKEFLSKGDLKIDNWFKELRTSTVIFENTEAFANVNTIEELQHLEAMSK